MGTFVRVEAEAAGDDALGILVPPGKRTFVILRPRLLGIDLVLCDGGRFRDLAHDEASAAAQALFRALREGSATVEVRDGTLAAECCGFVFKACARLAGQPYTMKTDATEALAARVRGFLRPAEGVEQPVYFNVRHFGRTEG
ncbi:MAG: hypothetical protein K2W96_13495 [Gemmataceae bacterium]|nr:hypothetical protein [Gemmataceae bacterium]